MTYAVGYHTSGNWNYDKTVIYSVLILPLVLRHQDGTLRSLDTHYVDTGMGLERITAVLNNKSSNYDTDIFMPIFSAIEKVC